MQKHRSGRKAQGFLLLQTLPILFASLVLLVAAVVSYGQCTRMMLRHNESVGAYEAVRLYESGVESSVVEQQTPPQLDLEKLESPLNTKLLLVETRACRTGSKRPVANSVRFVLQQEETP